MATRKKAAKKKAQKKPEKPYPDDWATTPGIYEGIPDRVYHADTRAVSHSQLTNVDRSPAIWQKNLIESDPDTDAMKLGRAFHTLVLEPQKFRERYMVVEKMNRNTNVWKGYVAAAKAEGKDIFQEQQIVKLMDMAKAVLTSGWEWLITGEDCMREVTVVAQDTDEFRRGVLDQLGCVDFKDAMQEYGEPLGPLMGGEKPHEMEVISQDINTKGTGLFLRVRIDSWFKAEGIWTDVKTCRSAHPEEFDRHVYNFYYHTQGAFYSDVGAAHGVSPQHFAFLCVEKEDPFMTQTYRLGDASMCKGRIKFCALLDKLARAKRDGIVPIYDPRILDVDIPGWAMNKI